MTRFVWLRKDSKYCKCDNWLLKFIKNWEPLGYDKWVIKCTYGGRKGSWLNVRYYFSITLKKLRKIIQNLRTGIPKFIDPPPPKSLHPTIIEVKLVPSWNRTMTIEFRYWLGYRCMWYCCALYRYWLGYRCMWYCCALYSTVTLLQIRRIRRRIHKKKQ
jgi:hypothetical protein